MVTEIERLKLRKLTYGLGNVTLCTKAREAKAYDTSLAIERNAWLVAPHINILVEVPISTCVVLLAVECPVRAIQRYPDIVQRLVVLDTLRGG